MTAPTAMLRALAQPLLADVGLELWDVEVGRDVVRFLVDKDGGVDLDALGEASRAVSGLLDDRDDLAPAGRYQLEVSSAGLERTLRTPAQYRRYVGATVSVKTSRPVAGARRHRGVLGEATDTAIELRPDAAPPVVLRYDEIERTRTVFEWGPAPKAGGHPSRDGARPAHADATSTKEQPR
ncbi:MAG: hypothetical protein ACYCUG_16220 [Acidimicrobiales bacterium]